MTQITGGKVVFSRKVQMAQYEPKEALAEIQFSVSEGGDHQAILNLASATAVGQVERMLTGKGLTVEVVVTPGGVTGGGSAQPLPPVTTPAEDAGRRRGPGRPAKVAAAPDAGPTTEVRGTDPLPLTPEQKPADLLGVGTAQTPAASSTSPPSDANLLGVGTTPASAPASSAETAPPATAPTSAPANATGPATVLDDSLFSAAPAVVTDKELMEAITAKNGTLQNPPKIRELIGRYVVAPGQAREITPDKRGAFLAELAALS